jgi:hypothetical protein
VCKQWRDSFGAHVQRIQLQQPKQEGFARTLGRKASAAFPYIKAVSIKLHCLLGGGSSRCAADNKDSTKKLAKSTAAMLRPLGKLCTLKKLQLAATDPHTYFGDGPFLYKVPLPFHLLPKLEILDLSCCCHQSSDLLVIARHLPQLQQLILFHPAFEKVTGGSVYTHHYTIWPSANYQAQHIAALAQLPSLQLLEAPLPVDATEAQRVDCKCGKKTHALHLNVGQHLMTMSMSKENVDTYQANLGNHRLLA